MMEIKITRTANPGQKPADESKLGFGKIFTDHMFIYDWDDQNGWHDARIVPFGSLELHPASTVFHYALEVFEGLKAYRTADGTVQLFRPDENAKRMINSAERIGLPPVPVDDFVQAVKTLISVDKDWCPHSDGCSLYIRPFLFGTDASVGLHTLHSAKFVIIVAPSGAYYANGINPVDIMIETEDVRAVRGGTGYTKCGGNYAAAQRATVEAEKKGFSQVLWLDGVERKYIEEVGSMNIMFKIDGKVVTPSIEEKTVLPGITRKSMLEVLRDRGFAVEERKISIEEIEEAAKAGKLEEAWGTGTAAVVSPVGRLQIDGVDYIINNGKIGEVTHMLYNTLTGIQWGKIEDKYGWTVKVD
ncbi:MAG: branched-chain amino acid aminotransferase [Eubacteriales bacterium]|nr:branched-chain amino acid aminotransferase [Eubacteriales bacterium]